MTFNKFLILLTAFALFLTACSGGNETPNANANTVTNTNTAASANTNTNTAAPANSEVATKSPTPAPTTNDAPTVKPVVLAYYEALKTKNEAALKKVYSKETLISLEKEMKADDETSLVKFITDLEPVPPQPYEVRNEQVNGDIIIAEMRSPQYPNGIRIQFVKEDGVWKLTNINPDFQKK